MKKTNTNKVQPVSIRQLTQLADQLRRTVEKQDGRVIRNQRARRRYDWIYQLVRNMEMNLELLMGHGEPSCEGPVVSVVPEETLNLTQVLPGCEEEILTPKEVEAVVKRFLTSLEWKRVRKCS